MELVSNQVPGSRAAIISPEQAQSGRSFPAKTSGVGLLLPEPRTNGQPSDRVQKDTAPRRDELRPWHTQLEGDQWGDMLSNKSN